MEIVLRILFGDFSFPNITGLRHAAVSASYSE
jgi:hypothetical protein